MDFAHTWHPQPDLPALTRAQVRQVDRLAIEQLAIPGIVLMENAAIALAQTVGSLIDTRNLTGAVLCCGPGNNGGDGLALARHLHNRSHDVHLTIALVADPMKYKGDARTNFEIIRRMGLQLSLATESMPSLTLQPQNTLIIDALLGTGAERPPTGPIAKCVRWINALHDDGAAVLAVDIPTGLDCDTGKALGDDAEVVHADKTVTLCAMKVGLLKRAAQRFAGYVTIGDIGVPPELIRRCADPADTK